MSESLPRREEEAPGLSSCMFVFLRKKIPLIGKGIASNEKWPSSARSRPTTFVLLWTVAVMATNLPCSAEEVPVVDISPTRAQSQNFRLESFVGTYRATGCLENDNKNCLWFYSLEDIAVDVSWTSLGGFTFLRICVYLNNSSYKMKLSFCFD